MNISFNPFRDWIEQHEAELRHEEDADAGKESERISREVLPLP